MADILVAMTKGMYMRAVVVVILVAVLLRFWDFSQRIIIYSDSARDVVVAQAAIAEKKIPLTGSFSSSGPFVFGPIYYWYLMAMYFFVPGSLFSPWYGVAFLSVLTVIFVAESMRHLTQEQGGLIAGLLAALSPAQILRSNSLTQHSLIGVFAAVAIWSMMLYIKRRTWVWIFILGSALGIAINLHYQALSLVVMGGVIFLFGRKNVRLIFRDALLYFLGLLWPFIPLFYWDAHYGWANLRNLMDFIFIAQYRIFISRRWLSFVREFLPQTFTNIVGGQVMITVMMMGLGIVVVGYLLHKRALKKEVLWLGFILVLQIWVIRYARVTLYEGYLVFVHPLMILLYGWILFQAFQLKYWQHLAGIFFVVTIFGAIREDVRILSTANSFAFPQQIIDQIIVKYPGMKFLPFDRGYASSEFSYGLSFFLQNKGLINQSGIPLGICLFACPPDIGTEIGRVKLENNYYVVTDLSATNPATLRPPIWYNVSPTNTLQEVGFWWEKKPLTSSFSIPNFLIGTLLGRD